MRRGRICPTSALSTTKRHSWIQDQIQGMPVAPNDLQTSESAMSQPAITILGGGIGGLTLGRCLRQKGIRSVIYDRASSAPRHTYGITLQPRAYKPLLNVLNIDETAFRKQLAVDNRHQEGIGRVSAGDNHDQTKAAVRVNQNALESMLREGQTIHLQHSLSSASVSEDHHTIGLHFENGITVRTNRVIDALGVHSQLRKSLLPEAVPKVHPFAVYSGKRYVKAEIFKSTYARAFGNGNVLIRNPSRPHDPRLEISVNEHLPDGSVSISYIYSRPAQNDTNSNTKPDPLHHPQRPIAGATTIPHEFYSELTNFITANNPTLEQVFTECFNADQIRQERLLHWLMRTIIIPKQDLLHLLDQGIIMIGDSVHAVPILGSHGANMAILDAIQLADVLAEQNTKAIDSNVGPNTALKEFYENKWQTWNDAVEKSIIDLAEMHLVPGLSVSESASNL